MISDHRAEFDTVVRFVGELTYDTAPILLSRKDLASGAIAVGKPVALDLSGLGFLDAGGLRAIHALRERLTKNNSPSTLVTGENRRVHTVLTATGFTSTQRLKTLGAQAKNSLVVDLSMRSRQPAQPKMPTQEEKGGTSQREYELGR